MDYFNHRSDTLQPIDKAEMTDRRFVSFHTIENNTSYDPTRVEYEYVRRQSSRWNNALIRAINAEDVAVIGEKDSIIDGRGLLRARRARRITADRTGSPSTTARTSASRATR